MNIDRELYFKYGEINELKYLMTLNWDTPRKKEYIDLLKNVLERVEELIMWDQKKDKDCSKETYHYDRESNKEFTLQELSYYDGSEGRPAYVAVNGKVYDVSLEAVWGGASHFGLKAGKDLTKEFGDCHKNTNILNNLKVVGVIKP